ncbi:type III secretion system export apparatus subunit SctR [Desulfothermus sp.]
MHGINFPDPFVIIVVLVGLSLAPFVAIMITSFVKLVVVLSLIRNALGIQQIPPNIVINGLAIILTMYIMYPVVLDSYYAVKASDISLKNIKSFQLAMNNAKIPIKKFLLKHSKKRERLFFKKSAKVLWPKEAYSKIKDDDILILLPSFIVSELTSAFQIGFLIYLPFIVIDIVISNILLAMGMMMVSPMTISLPFKLLLFVLIDGWTRLIHGLVLTYR